jgi:hypothetical protein
MKVLSDPRRQAVTLLSGLTHATASSGDDVKGRSFGSRLCAFIRSGNEGQALVETAVSMAIMAMLLTGAFSIALSLVFWETLNNAASVGSSELSKAGESGDPCAVVQAAAAGTLAFAIDKTKVTYTVTLQNSSGTTTNTYGPTTGTGFSCTALGTLLEGQIQAGSHNQPATLTVSYPYKWIPIYGMNMGTVNMGTSIPLSIY